MSIYRNCLRRIIRPLLLPALFFLSLTSCEKEKQFVPPSPKQMVDYTVSFNFEKDTLRLGDSRRLSPTFSPKRFYPGQTFEYQIGDSALLDLKVSSDYSAQIIPKAVGNTSIRIYTRSIAGKKEIGNVEVVIVEKQAAPPMAGIFINFGQGSAPGWTVFPDIEAGTKLENMPDKEESSTGISATLIEGFNAINTTGPTATNTLLNMPAAISKDSYFGNAFASYEGDLVKRSVLKLDGLDPDQEYDFAFFGSRMSVTDNRETKYAVSGRNAGADSINTSGNTTRLALVKGIKPLNDGSISITISPGRNNNNSYGFYYLTAMSVQLKP